MEEYSKVGSIKEQIKKGNHIIDVSVEREKNILLSYEKILSCSKHVESCFELIELN